jgi:hypothetical protein
MRRHITLLYSHADSERADAFRTRWAEHLYAKLEARPPVEAIDEAREMERGSTAVGLARSIVVILIGNGTADDSSLMERVAGGLGRGDVIVAVCIARNVKVPEVLHKAGCEVLDWDCLEIPQACERADRARRRAPAIIEAANSAGLGDEECARAPTAVVEGDHVPVPV